MGCGGSARNARIRRFEPGNQAQTRLLSKTQMILKANQIVTVARKFSWRTAPPRTDAGRYVDPSDPSASSDRRRNEVASAPSELLNGQASFEERRLIFRDVRGNGVGCEKRIKEPLELLAIERAIQIIVRGVDLLAVARGSERNREVDG